MFDKIGGLGASEVHKLFTGQGIKSKTAQTLCYEKALEIITGVKKNITTAPMTHGILNEFTAFEQCVLPKYPQSELQSSNSVLIADGLWATPDVRFENNVIDIKCPYTHYSYYQQIKKLNKNYQIQVNTQMLATGSDKGQLCYFLTAPINENGYKEEYETPLEDRTTFIEVPKIDDFESKLLQRFEDFKELRDSIIEDLHYSIDVDDYKFDILNKDKKVTKFKDKSNLSKWGGQIVKHRNDYYVIE